MDIRPLRHFVAVAETLHFGRAAERLGMTQPPLSQSIMTLERSLGAPLFARTKRSVALTPLGEQWLSPVQKALSAVDELPHLAKRLKDGVVGRVAVSFISIADYSVLPALVRQYASQFPDVEIALSEATSDVQIAGLLEGRGHVGIVIAPSGGLPPGLAYRKLMTEPLIAAVPETWVKDGRIKLVEHQLPASAVMQAPAISFPRRIAPSLHDLVSEFYQSKGENFCVVQEAIQMQTIISLVSAGMGIALVPASLRNLARTGVLYFELTEPAPILEIGLAWRRADMTPTLAHFIDIASNFSSDD